MKIIPEHSPLGFYIPVSGNVKYLNRINGPRDIYFSSDLYLSGSLIKITSRQYIIKTIYFIIIYKRYFNIILPPVIKGLLERFAFIKIDPEYIKKKKKFIRYIPVNKTAIV